MFIQVEHEKHEHPTVSELMDALRELQHIHGAGSLPILGGCITDNSVIKKLTIIDSNSVEWEPGNPAWKPAGIFIE